MHNQNFTALSSATEPSRKAESVLQPEDHCTLVASALVSKPCRLHGGPSRLFSIGTFTAFFNLTEPFHKAEQLFSALNLEMCNQSVNGRKICLPRRGNRLDFTAIMCSARGPERHVMESVSEREAQY